MKKIVVLLLIAALAVPSLFSCDLFKKEATPVTLVANMYKVSQPTKVVATTKQIIIQDQLELDGRYEIVTGYVDSKPASVYKIETEEIRSVEEGGQNEEVKDLVKSTSRVIEAIEGKGSRTNGGEWNAEGTVWTIGRGRMALNLSDELVKSYTYENHVLTLDIAKENVAKVLSEEYAQYVDGDVHIVIVDDGAVVTSVELTYFTAPNEEVNLGRTEMRVRVDYTYDIEKITIE